MAISPGDQIPVDGIDYGLTSSQNVTTGSPLQLSLAVTLAGFGAGTRLDPQVSDT
jgi:hypothetical protein